MELFICQNISIMRALLRKTFAILLILLLFSACASNIKPYERVYLDDPDMLLAPTRSLVFQNYVHSIREGSLTASGKKGSGGCGCN